MPEKKKNNQNHPGPSGSLRIVGIGASAGGLAALKTLFAAMPEDSGTRVRGGRPPVSRAQEPSVGTASAALPDARPAGDRDGRPRAEPCLHHPAERQPEHDRHPPAALGAGEKRRERAPIDHFLRTLAETHGERALGRDPDRNGFRRDAGAAADQGARGLTIAQEPEEAEYDGMPRSAIASGVVDLVLPLAEIPAHILGFARTEPNVAGRGGAKEARTRRRRRADAAEDLRPSSLP